MSDWKIKAAFKDLHAPLSKEERRILEEEIVAHGGARDPISTWRSFVADGHNRYEICTRLNLPYSTVDLTERFGSQEEVEEWIIRNQLGRRNLTAERFNYFIGKLYNAEKEEKGGDRKSEKSKDQNDTLISTASKIAEETGTSEATVKRAAKKAEALDAMPEGLKNSILDGKVPATDKAVKAFAAAEPAKQQEAARAVRTGQAPSLDVAMGIKAAKKETPPKADPAESETEESFPDEPLGTTKATKFNDKGLESHYGKLSRGMESRAKAMGGKGPLYKLAKDALIDFLQKWNDWRRAGAGAR